MTKSVLEFDEIAADDALIEAIRSGAEAADLPADDPAPSLLLALRDGAAGPAEDQPAATSGGLGAVVRHRRVFASGVAACVLAVAGVGTAVAGDPTAAFSFMFREGVDLGSRFGSPVGEDHALAPVGGGDQVRPLDGPSSSPVRQGSAAAPWSDDRGAREPFGYEEEHSQTWEDRGRDDRLDSFADSDRSTSDTEGDGELTPDGSWPTGSPEDDERPTPEEQTYGPESDDSEDQTDDTGPTEEYGPTYTDPTESSPSPTESSPTESSPTPTESSPTESSPTEPSPTESSPTEPSPTESSPTPTSPTSPTPGEPTSSPTETSPSPSPTETSPTP